MESFLESAEYTVYQNRTLRYFYLLQLRFLRVAKNKRNERLLYSFRLGDTYGENIKKKKKRELEHGRHYARTRAFFTIVIRKRVLQLNSRVMS